MSISTFKKRAEILGLYHWKIDKGFGKLLNDQSLPPTFQGWRLEEKEAEEQETNNWAAEVSYQLFHVEALRWRQ